MIAPYHIPIDISFYSLCDVDSLSWDIRDYTFVSKWYIDTQYMVFNNACASACEEDESCRSECATLWLNTPFQLGNEEIEIPSVKNYLLRTMRKIDPAGYFTR